MDLVYSYSAFAIAYLLLLVTGAIGMVGGVLLAMPLLGLALLAIKPLRRALITRHVLGWFKNVLPEMSATEREAIQAGEPWWEAEMFRGRPDWSKLLSFEYTQLSAEEQSFLDNETNADQANLLARAELYQGDYKRAARFVDDLREVTPRDIQRAASKYMVDVRWAYVGDPSKLTMALLNRF